jgi:hypothetical protein
MAARVIAVAVLALMGVLALATTGGLGVGGSIALAQYQYDHKVTICHNAGNGQQVTIRISRNALPAHMENHDDTLGPCP